MIIEAAVCFPIGFTACAVVLEHAIAQLDIERLARRLVMVEQPLEGLSLGLRLGVASREATVELPSQEYFGALGATLVVVALHRIVVTVAVRA